MRRKKPQNRLRVLRANHRWTQTDVAHRMGMATYYRYWQIENDVRIPTFKERAKLARIFGVREWEIFPALVRKAA